METINKDVVVFGNIKDEKIGEDKVDVMETDVKELAKELNYYTIVAPKIFRSNSDYELNLTLHNSENQINEPVIVSVAIEDDQDENLYRIQRDVTLKMNVTQSIRIPIRNIDADRQYKLVVNGVSGLKIAREASLNLQTKIHSVMIQTDKAIYKPNDCVKFRVLVLDKDLRSAPINNGELSIQVIVSDTNCK